MTVQAASGRRGATAPGLFEGEARRAWNLAWALALTDFKLRFYGSVLGVAWTLVRPFAFFAVIYVVFAEIADLGNAVENYPAYILIGLVLFQFFGEITGASVTGLVARENLLRKMRFPRIVVPMAIAINAMLNLGMTLVAVVGFYAIIGVYPGWGWLELVPLIGLLIAFAVGVGLILMSLYVRFRDVQPIWDVFSQMLFYASPVLYVATSVPSDYLRLYLCNPIAAIFTQVRHAVVDPAAPTAAQAMGGAGLLLIPLGIVAGCLALGLWVFNREAPRVAENL